MYQLGSYQDVSDRKNCPLCKIITEAYGDGPLLFGPRSSASWSKDLRIQGCWEQTSLDSHSSCLRIYMIQFHEERKARLLIRPLGNSGHPHPHFAQKVSDPLIDFKVVQGWLKNCEESHVCNPPPASGLSSTPSPALFKVIDVQQMCIVELPPGCRYLTLSYVWGSKKMFLARKENAAQLSRPGGLQAHWEELCPTIRDAIQFTKKLGEKYLWIDSLCIVQDGGSEVLDSIHDMDLVYTQATAMICAADDRSLDQGLPGVVFSRKPRQYVREILPGLTVVAQHDFLEFVDDSAYATRGWT